MKRKIRTAGATLKYRVLLGALAGIAAAALGAAVAVAASPGDGFTRGNAIEVTFPPTFNATVDSTNAPHSIRRKIGDSFCGSSLGDSNVVWFKWTATTSLGPINVHTTGSSYDTVLYLFEGGKLIECDDDTAFLGIGCPVESGQTHCSFVDFRPVLGKKYKFAVAQFGPGAVGGDTHLTVEFE
jgi:hypothetical protein